MYMYVMHIDKRRYIQCYYINVILLVKFSDFILIFCGVSQGSIVGPFLFISYITEISNTSYSMYAILFEILSFKLYHILLSHYAVNIYV